MGRSQWIARNVIEYNNYQEGLESKLDADMVEAMEETGYDWRTRRDQTWGRRIQELLEYKGMWSVLVVVVVTVGTCSFSWYSLTIHTHQPASSSASVRVCRIGNNPDRCLSLSCPSRIWRLSREEMSFQ